MLIITNKLTIETHLMWSREFGGAYVWWWKTGLGSSRIGRHSGLGKESLDPRVLDSVCLESGRSFFTSLEPRLGRRRKWLNFNVGFGFTMAFFSDFEPLNSLYWQNLLISLNVFFFLSLEI